MKASRGFKGVWIPKEIWLNPLLSLMEKVFLVEINSLDNETGCFASNDHFAKFFGITKARCTQVIKSLKEKGILTVDYAYRSGSREIEKRTLKVCSKFSYEGDKFPYEGSKKIIRGSKKTIKISIHSNNTVNNTIKEKGSAGASSANNEEEKLFFNAIKEVWFRHHPDWQFSAKDGAGLKGIFNKLNKWQKSASKEVTPQTTAAAFDYLLSHRAVKDNNFLSTADPSTLSGKLNSIYENLKNNTDGKTVSGNTGARGYDPSKSIFAN